ncbi:probable ATP-dependent RNA helicase DRS1 [Cephalotrichum gorgonifer]|uniref:RNA helicase n=1 Tax=Cephalotrichum gorgonifer TaxID=2041049 RepID=A0AAE8STH3_9PEZI|nr:probable ATP-dependent RNA helicase DRS1 [Cephalotrichum gorgonifer]
MTASQRKRAVDDDFIYTISDSDEVPDEETLDPQPPKKKAKSNKKNKGDAEKAGSGPSEGLWGKNDEDDGAMASDFEFFAEGTNELDVEEFAGWGFEGAHKAMKGEKPGVDLDAIIQRRRAKKEAKGEAKATGVPAGEDEAEDINDLGLDLDDADDEILADDAFGMTVDLDGEQSDIGESDADNEEDGNASDDEAASSPVPHPDNSDDDDDDDDDDEEEDPEEKARRDAFFAPEEAIPNQDRKGKDATFQSMSLSRPVLRGLAAAGYTKPTPIQSKTIPIALLGKDVVGGAVTGSGKTAAFVLPIIERLIFRPKKVPTSRVVILTPTRELAIQCHAVATKLASFTDIKFTLAVGGLSLKAQELELRLRPDVIIATPGRFIDHVRNSASFSIDAVEILVLDEADRMLEDGFADELNEILTTLPKSRQTMLFSATMTSSVDHLIRAGLNTPVRLVVDSKRKTAGTLTQEFVRLRPGREDKRMGYLLWLCKNVYHERVIIFFRQKKQAHLARIVFGLLGLSCSELHGSLNQSQRISAVESFRDGKVSFLLATDLASRGLDIKGVDTVINYEAPQNPEIYVHRVGRTARAGRTGSACTLAAEPDRKVVRAAVKAAKSQGAKITSRVVDPAEADAWQKRIDEMEKEIEEVMQEEKEEKQIAHVEMQVKKGENLIEHEAEIKARPRRTWFETEKEKKASKEAGRAELNGLREKMKKKHGGKLLSNKDKKKLDAKAERAAGGTTWKKGRAERDGKGAVLEFSKNKVKKKGGRVGSKGGAKGGKGRGGGKK